MGDLAPNLSRHEVACNCGCGFATADVETVRELQACCDHIAASLGIVRVILNIHSWCRCCTYNIAVGGSGDSEHLKGTAVDFSIEWVDGETKRKVDPDLVYNYLHKKHPNRYGVGRYADFTHLDTKVGCARRWRG